MSSSSSSSATSSKKRKAPPAEGGAEALAATSKRAPLAPSAHAGPSNFSLGQFAKAGSFPQFTAAILPRKDSRSLKILAWNVNGVRAALKTGQREHVLEWLKREDADIVCLQETRIDDSLVAQFKNAVPGYTFSEWNCCVTKKGYAGTAVLARETAGFRVTEVLRSLGSRDPAVLAAEQEGRVLSVKFSDGTVVINAYTPNSGQTLDRLPFRTTQWDPAFASFAASLATLSTAGAAIGSSSSSASAAPGSDRPRVIIVGDLNVCHFDCDIHSPVQQRNKVAGFCDGERDGFAALLSTGFVDVFRHLHPTQQQFTYWSARGGARESGKGFRLDYALVSAADAGDVEAVDVRSAFPLNDHVPLVMTLKRRSA